MAEVFALSQCTIILIIQNQPLEVFFFFFNTTHAKDKLNM